MESIVGIINDRYNGLTRKQKEIADYMLAHVEDMCYITLRALSRETGVSEMTVLNFCAALGYGSFNEVKFAFRNHMLTERKEAASRISYYSSAPRGDELSDEAGLFHRMGQEEMETVVAFYNSVGSDDYLRAAEMIASAKRVIIGGRGISNMAGHYIAGRLTLYGVPCIEVNTEIGESVQRALCFADEETVVIPISFPDYYFMTVKLARFTKDSGARLIGITDSARAEIDEVCDMCLYCQTNDGTLLNSPTVPMLAAYLLTAAVGIVKNRGSGDRAPKKSGLFNI